LKPDQPMLKPNDPFARSTIEAL